MWLEELLFHTLQRIELLDPWHSTDGRFGEVNRCFLAGGFVLHFGHLALVCTSPMRYAHCQVGTIVGAPEPMQLGYRLTLIDVDDVESVLPNCQNRYAICSSNWLGAKVPPILLLTMLEQVDEGFCTTLNILGQEKYSLTYRPDLDGSIQLAPHGQTIDVGLVHVHSPNASLGYLHPASAHPVVIDGTYWPHADLNCWPMMYRKQSALDPTGQAYRDQLRKLLLARFRQHPSLKRRLLALQCAVSVAGVPAGLIEDITAELREGSDC